ncbi:ATP-binding protein [Chlorobium phaeobacteroides]|nr:AAA family ATPase [Chlorobium phaeobacteroides]
MKIAVSGKGGVGKTTISSLIALGLAEKGKKVLAIDADPNGNLAEALGYNSGESGRITPLIERKALIEERTGARPGEMGGYFVLNPKVDDFVERFSVPVGGLRTMVMGELKEALSGCYCAENALLRSFLRHLMVDRDEWVVLDMEAGFEHLTRGTAQSVDLLLIVVEPGARSIATAHKLQRLALQSGIPRTGFLVNKLYSPSQKEQIIPELEGGEILASIPFDEMAVEADLAARSPFGSCSLMKESLRPLIEALSDNSTG